MAFEIHGLTLSKEEQDKYLFHLKRLKNKARALRELSDDVFYEAWRKYPETPDLQRMFDRASQIIKVATELPH